MGNEKTRKQISTYENIKYIHRSYHLLSTSPGAWHCANYLKPIIQFNPQINHLKWVLLLFVFYQKKMKHRDVIQLVNGRVHI